MYENTDEVKAPERAASAPEIPQHPDGTTKDLAGAYNVSEVRDAMHPKSIHV